MYLFGTDWLGRDMLARTLTGLSMSIRIGLCTAGISACIALVLGIMSAVLGIIALVSLFLAVYETFRNQGQALVKSTEWLLYSRCFLRWPESYWVSCLKWKRTDFIFSLIWGSS